MEMNRELLAKIKTPLVLILVREYEIESYYQPRPVCVLLPHQVESAIEDMLKNGRWKVKNVLEIYVAPMESMQLVWDRRTHGINPSMRKKQ